MVVYQSTGYRNPESESESCSPFNRQAGWPLKDASPLSPFRESQTGRCLDAALVAGRRGSRPLCCVYGPSSTLDTDPRSGGRSAAQWNV